MIRPDGAPRFADRSSETVNRILQAARRGTPLVTFLEEATNTLLETSGAGAVVVCLEGWIPTIRCRASIRAGSPFRLETVKADVDDPASGFPGGGPESAGALIHRYLLRGNSFTQPTPLTDRGSYWSPDAWNAEPLQIGSERIAIGSWARAGSIRSLALIPMRIEGRQCGLVEFICERAGAFDESDVLFFEDIAGIFALGLSHHRAQWALQERVKELTCLYEIAKTAGQQGLSTPDILAEIVRVLPQGWQYPSECDARISFDGETIATPRFVEGGPTQSADITMNGVVRGRVEVAYCRAMPEMHEGPFLAEERSLIDEVARQVAEILGRREAEGERAALERQLFHSERLATIGTLTAGIAHELNEPLGGILGFAQIVRETQGLPAGVARDVDRIVNAAFHAREIIKKLMLFGRQTPPDKSRIDLNRIVDEGIDLLEPRFAAEGVRCERILRPLPSVVADASQMRQVVVNLAVNAMQAMPRGGTLRLSTTTEEGWIVLSVEDTGVGMPEDVLRQIFVPFFTTKDVGQGTGLGLPVVHGIVAAHGGRIDVESEVGVGTRFLVRLPASTMDGSGHRSTEAE